MTGNKVRLAIYTFCAALVLTAGVVFLCYHSEKTQREARERALEPAFAVHFVTPDGSFDLDADPNGVLTLPEGETREGYAFFGWEDETGALWQPGKAALEAETSFTAVYRIALLREEHPSYLFPDEEGRCTPSYPLTRADAARMFYALLGVKGESGSSFADIQRDDPLYEASSTLKTLGVMKGKKLDPDSAVTRGELFSMLAFFYPESTEHLRFADVQENSPYYAACCLAAEQGWIKSGKNVSVTPNRVVTRLEAAKLMNRALGRGEKIGSLAEVAYALRDLPSGTADRNAMLEALVPHEYALENGALRWTSAEPPHTLIPGFTSGDWELDKLLAQIRGEVLDEDADQTEQLRALYRHVRDKYRYRKGKKYATGDTSWLVEEAKKIASTGAGNCYSYAALLCELFRTVGVDAEVYSGKICGSPHGWVEADIDGVRYIFDVEMECAYRRSPNRENINMFMKTYEQMRRWRYDRG